MKIKNVSGAAVTDLGVKDPFTRGASLVVINLGASPDTLQESDASTGPFTTVSGANAVASLTGVEVVISKRYVAIENGAGNFVILGN